MAFSLSIIFHDGWFASSGAGLHYLVSLQPIVPLPLCILFARLANIFAKADLRQFELSKDMEIKWDE